MLPESIAVLDNRLSVFVSFAAGFAVFFVLEQWLRWHHCHRVTGGHEPLGYLILPPDGVHNLIGGLAVGEAFVVDIRLGSSPGWSQRRMRFPKSWAIFGILVHMEPAQGPGIQRRFGSHLRGRRPRCLRRLRPVGRVILVPFAAGNFVYIAAADQIPQDTATNRYRVSADLVLVTRDKVEQSVAFGVGFAVLLAGTLLT